MKSAELSDVLSEFARTMVTDFPIEGILDQLVSRIVDVLPITAAGVTLISPGADPRYIAASNGSALRFEKLQSELGEGPCVAAYESGVPVSMPDLGTDERFSRFSTEAVKAGLAAVFTFPLNHGDRRLGALDLYRDTPGELTGESMRAAQTLADVAAAYLLNAQARSDLVESAARSTEAALHDPLTGLANRVLMLQRLEHALLRQRRTGKTLALLFVDLDRFKAINDTYGHQAGDAVLVDLAARLSAVLRPGDTLARQSGDEFLILLEDLDGPAQARAVADRVHAAMMVPFHVPGGEVHMTACVGVALSDHGDLAPGKLIHEADLAMYRGKPHLRGRADAMHPGDLHLGGAATGVERALAGAAARDELRLVYQPIVSLDGEIAGVEALLRWSSPDLGEISPTVLIPLAEHSGDIVAIGRWALQQAWSARQDWQSEHAPGLSLAVNVSVPQFMSGGFVETVSEVLEGTSVDPACLTLEVTESIFLRDRDRALVILEDLKDIGVMLALDDFGTGFSSLNYLMAYPVDIVKIDRVFISKLASDPASKTIVSAVIQLAHDRGMRVVAEGVETAEQRHNLAQLGCDHCQGFYFSQPMPSDSLAKLIGRRGNGTALHLPDPVAQA
jgi:diguanylate cyclase (GGDEF)-like protein